MKQKNYKGFTQVGAILSGKMDNQKLQQAFYRQQAIKFWGEVSSGFISNAKDLAKAVDLKNGVLVIACLSRELAYQIKLLSQRIINEINLLVGKAVVYAIFVEN